jgi:transposase
MLTEKNRNFQTQVVTLSELVPADNFYRQLEAKLDLSFVRKLVQEQYSSKLGRPSIDPVVFFKLQLIMFFEGIRSERKLVEMVDMRLDCRWYIGYDFCEIVPNHSSLSKIRSRYGLEIFQRFFEQIVQVCIDADLVWGQELYFDATKVRANADKGRMVNRWYLETQEYLESLFEPEAVESQETMPIARRFVDKYDGTRHFGRRKVSYERITDSKANLTDPDASPMRQSNAAQFEVGYHTHYVVDGGKARIILGVLVTPASIMENTPMLDMCRWVRFRWQLKPQIAVGDSTYGTVLNIVGLEQDGIAAYVPIANLSERGSFYPTEMFHYDSEKDLFICPQGQELRLHSRSQSEQEFVYRANSKICNACPVKSQCTESKTGRHLRRSFFQEYLDRVKAYHETEDYKKAMRKRQLWPEPLFGEAKQWHQMRQFLLRGLDKVNIQSLIVAAGQNIKRLVKTGSGRKPLAPVSTNTSLPPEPVVSTPWDWKSYRRQVS